MSELNVKSAKYADGIMREALEHDGEFSSNAKHTVEAAREHGWRLEKILAFLLTVAVDGHIMQPDFNEHGEDLVNALRGFAHVVNTGAQTIADAIGYDEDGEYADDDFDFFDDAEDGEAGEAGEAELPTPAEVEVVTGHPCDKVVAVTRPVDIDPETWDNVMQAYSQLNPRTAFIYKAE